ncbi:hypothetical protein DID80_02245 [Candidatus Marinamargulisbacteria bacterium SCGC AAA071-K20]|nr:hypothetical protein DID80_02245 [Candidatus Marinamargulisbacteria bacterium SCGC AAA071-K20]
MTRFKSFFIAVFFLFTLTGVCVASTMEETPIESISIGSEQIKLETPALKKNNHLYVPIRDILKELNGRLVYKKKTDSYALMFPGYTIGFKPYSLKTMINGTAVSLKSPPIFAMGRVYIPIALLTKSSHKVVRTKTSLSIRSSHKKRASTSKKVALKKTVRKKTKKKLKLPKLPSFSKKKPSSLNYFNKTFPLKHKYFYKGDVLYVELLPFFKKIGYNITKQKNMVTVSTKSSTFTFYTKKNVVYTKIKSKKKRHVPPHKLIVKNKKIYFPLSSTLQIFDYGYAWSSKDNSIYLLSKISSIESVNYKNVPLIKINSSHPLSVSPTETLLLRHGLYFDINYSVLDTNDRQIKDLGFDQISKVKAKKLDLKTTRIRLFSQDSVTAPNIVKTRDGLEISFNSYLSGIKEAKKDNLSIFRLEGKGPFDVSVRKTKNPPKLIVDITNCVTTMPQIKRSSSGVYKQIRTSQFKKSPYITRMVVDFEGVVPNVSHVTSSEYIELRMTPVPKARVASKKPTKARSKPVQKKRLYSKSQPLKNRVIFVDAGHGGRDPGAVVSKKYYEKTYNLDIAKRLKRRLEAKGAIVIMSRTKDRSLSLGGRSYLANKNKSDIMVSIHINSFVQSKAHGTETYYYKYKDKRLATHIQKQLAKDLRLKNNGVKRARLYILRNSRMPSALIEPVFMTNTKEHQLLKSPVFRQRIADSVYQGITNYFRSMK